MSFCKIENCFKTVYLEIGKCKSRYQSAETLEEDQKLRLQTQRLGLRIRELDQMYGLLPFCLPMP